MKQNNKKTLIIIIIIIAIAAAALVYFFFGRGASSSSGDAVFVQPVSLFTGDGVVTERFSGIVETQKTDKTEFDSSRKLDQLFVAVGDIVKEGDDLFSYDTESIRLEIEQLRLEIDKLNMDINSSTEEINALNASIEKASSEDKPEYLATIKQRQADIAQAQYDVKSKESEINRKEASINESVVKARMGGIVEKIADAQDIIDGKNYTDDGSTDNTFIIIRAEGDYRVKGKADEQSISRLYQGMEVTVRSRIDDKFWGGTVSVIDTQSTESSGESDFYGGDSESASKYAFYVELDSTKDILLGQHVIIEPGSASEKQSGIWLSSGFVVQDGGEIYIWAAKDENSPLEKRGVTTGSFDESTNTYQITSGLSESDLIAWPDSDCREGAPVTTEYNVQEEDVVTDDTDMGDPGTDVIDMGDLGADDTDMGDPGTDVIDTGDLGADDIDMTDVVADDIEPDGTDMDETDTDNTDKENTDAEDPDTDETPDEAAVKISE